MDMVLNTLSVVCSKQKNALHAVGSTQQITMYKYCHNGQDQPCSGDDDTSNLNHLSQPQNGKLIHPQSPQFYSKSAPPEDTVSSGVRLDRAAEIDMNGNSSKNIHSISFSTQAGKYPDIVHLQPTSSQAPGSTDASRFCTEGQSSYTPADLGLEEYTAPPPYLKLEDDIVLKQEQSPHTVSGSLGWMNLPEEGNWACV
jgi:hypothetical protein